MAVAESDWHICSWSGSRSGQLLKRALSRRRARCCIRLSATSAPLAVLHSHWLKTIVVGYVYPNVLSSVPCCCRGTPAPGHCASLLNGYAGLQGRQRLVTCFANCLLSMSVWHLTNWGSTSRTGTLLAKPDSWKGVETLKTVLCWPIPLNERFRSRNHPSKFHFR